MDEMTLLKDLGQELVDAGAPLKPQTRQRALAGPAARGVRFGRTAGAPRRRPVRRLAIPLGAAAMVGGFGFIALTQAHDAQPSITPMVAAPAVRSLSAEQILLAAAVTARAGDDSVPPARSFVYTRSKELYAQAPANGTRESWYSVDGSRSGAVTPTGSTTLETFPGCVRGRPRMEDGLGGWMPCKPDPAYRADFPTTRSGARKMLYHNDFIGTDHHDDYSAFEKAGELLMERMLPPASRAAVFEALATISGTEVVTDAVTATGKHGVAVTYLDAERKERNELIFDPTTHTLIGRRSIGVGTVGKQQQDVVNYSAGVIESGIVSRVGLRPDGTVRPGHVARPVSP
jgi:hypothetical protein